MGSIKNELSPLLEKVVQDGDRRALEEAILCADAGAVRLAYVGVWLAVAGSIRGKLAEMGVRDSKAREASRKLDEAERKRNAIDRQLLEAAKKLGLITDHEFKKLDSVLDIRHDCAHPRQDVSIRVAEFRSAVTVAVDAVLSKPARLGDQWAYMLTQRLFEDEHVIDDDPGEIRRWLKESVLSRLREGSRPTLVGALLNKIQHGLGDPDPEARRFVHRGISVARTVIELHLEDAAEEAFEDWALSRWLEEAGNAAARVLAQPRAWPQVPWHLQNQIVSLLITPLSSETIVLIGALDQEGLLRKRQRKRWTEALREATLEVVEHSGLQLAIVFPKILTDLKDPEFEVCNPAARALVHRYGPIQSAELDSSQQIELARSLTDADIAWNSWGTQEAMAAMAADAQWPADLRAGLIVGLLVDNSNDEVRALPADSEKIIRVAKAAGTAHDPNHVVEVVNAWFEQHHQLPDRYLERYAHWVARLSEAAAGADDSTDQAVITKLARLVDNWSPVDTSSGSRDGG